MSASRHHNVRWVSPIEMCIACDPVAELRM
jgi:hypothetical protein